MFRLSALSTFSLVLLVSLSSCRHDAEVPPVIALAGDSICFDQVQRIMQNNCAIPGCHTGGGELFPLVNYDDIKNEVSPGSPNKSKIYKAITAVQLSGNIMPPSNYPPLTNNDITKIQLWILDGAKQTSCTDYCDSINVNFSGTIMHIVSTNCQKSCHDGTNASTSLKLTSYSEIKSAIISKNLIDHIQQLNDYSVMPPYPLNPLSPCNIAQFKKWITDGLQQY